MVEAAAESDQLAPVLGALYSVTTGAGANLVANQIEEWQTTAHTSFTNPVFLRQLFVERTDLLTDCSEEEIEILREEIKTMNNKFEGAKTEMVQELMREILKIKDGQKIDHENSMENAQQANPQKSASTSSP